MDLCEDKPQEFYTEHSKVPMKSVAPVKSIDDLYTYTLEFHLIVYLMTWQNASVKQWHWNCKYFDMPLPEILEIIPIPQKDKGIVCKPLLLVEDPAIIVLFNIFCSNIVKPTKPQKRIIDTSNSITRIRKTCSVQSIYDHLQAWVLSAWSLGWEAQRHGA